MGKRSDLIGQKFNKLIAVDRIIENRRSFYLCICDCGNTIVAEGNKLSASQRKTCGCGRKDSYESRGLARRLPKGLAVARRVINYYKRNAKRRGIDFELTEEDCLRLFKLKCFYCGTVPKNTLIHESHIDTLVYNGIDRKNNDLHYTIENCVPCCKYCNFMKNNLTVELFSEHISKIYHNLNPNKDVLHIS